ncbi:MAG: hypothetical protein HY344_03350 [Candidatus Levybacteria bacterium]|nr:hypothetical protein [Candidatus Levybacteria bacterium]
MFGRNSEARIYTEEDLVRIDLAWLSHGIRPPAEISKMTQLDDYHWSFDNVGRAAIDAHNARAIALQSQRATERRKPVGTLKRVLAAAATVFIAGARR